MNRLPIIGSPYTQSAQNDLWLPVKLFGVNLLVKLLPLIAITIMAILVGRAFGPLLFVLAVIIEFRYEATERPAQTGSLWLAAATFTLLWLLDAWPAPFHLSYKFFWEGAPVIRYAVKYQPWQPMRGWLFLRVFGIIGIPYILPAAWESLNWRTLVEIVAPSFANSIVKANQDTDIPMP